MLLLANEWDDYKILDAGNGEKLEQWGEVVLCRPDPQIIWKTDKKVKAWDQINGMYHRSEKGGGEWEIRKKKKKK